jgi:hypothetical protein
MKYPLLTQKRVSFLLFKDIIELMKNKEHLTPKGLHLIMGIRASMNKGISSELLKYFNNEKQVIPVSKPLVDVINTNHISPD